MKVSRRRFDVTTVRGPLGELSVCFEYRLMSDFTNVVFPTCAQSNHSQFLSSSFCLFVK